MMQGMNLYNNFTWATAWAGYRFRVFFVTSCVWVYWQNLTLADKLPMWPH